MNQIRSFIHGVNVVHEGVETPLVSPIDLSAIGHAVEATQAVVTEAVNDAWQAYLDNKSESSERRISWLNQAATGIETNAEELIGLIICDVGKPRRAATFEVNRAVQFMRSVAVQMQTLCGEVLPLDVSAAGVGHFGFTRRIPFGVVAAITPFNAPINLMIQKVAPALVVGNSVVVKPHPAGARVALAIARIMVATGLPKGLLNVVVGDRAPAIALVASPKVAAITFTGGTAAGTALSRAAGSKKFVAELGSNSANVVLDDADLKDAATRIAAAAFEASGQQCVSAQRVIVMSSVYGEFLEHFVQSAKALKCADPQDPKTDLGPMVSLAQANRVMDVARSAIAVGGRFALEPHQQNCIVSPGILVDVPLSASIWCDEIFGPLVVVQRASSVDEALALANDTPFGLQGSVFTRDLAKAFRFADQFDVGSLWINEASRFRLDNYPFGGVKESGHGREGVRYAIEELSQVKFIGIRPGA
jgi:acyl-CoA reductase-like NAD-dependent aldehyde dehydrogenase